MYTVKPRGINIKQNDRNVADGFLQESINMQFRDGSYKPIPERIDSGITDVDGKDDIILHKVSDEDVTNVLMFSSGELYWYGVINNGIYVAFDDAVAISDFPTVTNFDSFSFQVLNNIIYLMSYTQYFYYKLEYNEDDEVYDVSDMYAWKDLVPYFPKQGVVSFTYDAEGIISGFPSLPFIDITSNCALTRCGCILIRFTLSLDTGEEVLHTTPYMFSLYGLNASSVDLEEDEAIRNIHTFINLNLAFADDDVYADHISAINVYASIPDYKSAFSSDVSAYGVVSEYTTADMMTQFQEQGDASFYLVKTIDNPSATDKVLLYANFDTSLITYDGDDLVDTDSVYMVQLSSIAAGAVMPTDNYSYHKLFGKLKSYNNRLILEKPTTVMSEGYGRALSTSASEGMEVGFKASTEDGVVNGVSSHIDTSFSVENDFVYPRGLIAYPDSQGTQIYFGANGASELQSFNISENESSNTGCNYTIANVDILDPTITIIGNQITVACQYEVLPIYAASNDLLSSAIIGSKASYSSGNRAQFSEAGEYSVWPVINSYRVGGGIIMFIGDNSVNPSNSDYLAPLIIGTSDGIYSTNFDSSGSTLIQSITKLANIPAISKEAFHVDLGVVFVSDNGLILMNNGVATNLTEDFFPSQGTSGYNVKANYLANYLASYLVGINSQDSFYPNYKLLTEDFFGEFNSYIIADIVSYMKSAVFAYDSRRANLWCYNPSRNFSMIFNFTSKQWSTSTYKYSKVIELFGVINTSSGEVYSRYLTLNSDSGLDILSSEDLATEVNVHMFTRAIKIGDVDTYKKVERIITRCTLYKKTSNAYFSFGLWGKQDMNRTKENIPLIAYLDGADDSFPNNIRQDIPIGQMKGKYKALSILFSGLILPDSSFDGFDIVASQVDTKNMR